MKQSCRRWPGARNEKGDLIALDVKAETPCCSANGQGPKSRSTANLLIMKESDIMGIV